jgi:hypothetical protein
VFGGLPYTYPSPPTSHTHTHFSRRRPQANFPWSSHDAALAALPSLVRLRISGQLLSPALLGGLTRLTRLTVEGLPLATYSGWYLEEGREVIRTDALAEELPKLMVCTAERESCVRRCVRAWGVRGVSVCVGGCCWMCCLAVMDE